MAYLNCADEALYYGGLALAGVGIVLLAISLIVLFLWKKRLNRRLFEKYGTKQR